MRVVFSQCVQSIYSLSSFHQILGINCNGARYALSPPDNVNRRSSSLRGWVIARTTYTAMTSSCDWRLTICWSLCRSCAALCCPGANWARRLRYIIDCSRFAQSYTLRVILSRNTQHSPSRSIPAASRDPGVAAGATSTP